MSEKRNIVLITLDSVRADHCSFMGYRRKTTPTIDKMARRGVYFRNAIASGVPTMPSMFSIFTGEFAPVDVYNYSIKDWMVEIKNKTTLAQKLVKMGYVTLAIHMNPALSKIYGFDSGFIYYEDFLSENVHYFKGWNALKSFLNRKYFFSNWESIYPIIQDCITKKLKEPYFLWILLIDTHLPYIPPKHFRKFGPKSYLHILYLNWKVTRNFRHFEGRDVKYFYNITEKERQKLVGCYDDCIRYADEFIKHLWNDLRDTDPIFIIHADHGEGFGEHGFYWHPAMLYEEMIHVPLVIYNADMQGVVENAISLKSLYNIIVNLLNIADISDVYSLSSEVNKGYAVSKILSRGKWKVAIRMNEWKYIYGQSMEGELYNLEQDPNEKVNLINDKNYEKIKQRMKNIVEKLIIVEKEKLKIRKISKKLKL